MGSRALIRRSDPTAAIRVVLLLVLASLAVLPLVLLLLTSYARGWYWPDLLPTSYSAGHWRLATGEGGDRLLRATISSLGLALGTGLLTSAISLPIGRAISGLRGWQRALGTAAAFLPVAAPPIAIGIGLQYSFLRLGLGGSAAGVLFAHLVPALGYGTLFFLGIFAVYDEAPEAEARTLGASRMQVIWTITLPRLARPLVEAALLGFLVSWAQVPLTILVGQGMVPTLAVEVLTYVQGGQDSLAATGALLLIAPAAAAVLLAGLAIRRIASAPV